ncbi:unnamed protein product [Owenia fusiformis]|uniref:Uncharacterized protein n=1 Tax=Owenia fusiformis TaxID=6347 RepID=A0A8S4Q5D5_OWEFU|nr:unnamed protein product [Owenia fusiformis]
MYLGERLCSAFALWLLLYGCSLVTGKCSGRWAIHACAGGNGKRSQDNAIDYKVNTLNDDFYGRLLQKLMPQTSEENLPFQHVELNRNTLPDGPISLPYRGVLPMSESGSDPESYELSYDYNPKSRDALRGLLQKLDGRNKKH